MRYIIKVRNLDKYTQKIYVSEQLKNADEVAKKLFGVSGKRMSHSGISDKVRLIHSGDLYEISLNTEQIELYIADLVSSEYLDTTKAQIAAAEII